MARSTLQTPFAAQQNSSSSSSRISPFQHAATAAALHGLNEDDIESGWLGGRQRLRQRYLDVFEPVGSHMLSSSSSTGHARRGESGMQQARAATPVSLRIVTAQEWLSLHRSADGSMRAADTVPGQALMFRNSVRTRDPPVTAPTNLPRLRAAFSFDTSSTSSSGRHRQSSSGSTALRRLQRRSSALLAATSTTASHLWSTLSSLGDRSRLLLCRSSPVSDDDDGRDSSDHDVVAGPDVFSPDILQAVQTPGAMLHDGRSPRVLQHRFLTRSATIRRSTARSPAVLVDIDATNSYDDLLALDQFNVKRAVKGSVLNDLPSRTPNADDEQQQRQCHICFESWLPCRPETDPSPQAEPCSPQQPSCPCCCGKSGGHKQQQVPQVMPGLPPLTRDRGQHRVLDRLQLVCWDGPLGPQGTLVPVPASPRLIVDDETDDGSSTDWPASPRLQPSRHALHNTPMGARAAPEERLSAQRGALPAGVMHRSPAASWHGSVAGWTHIDVNAGSSSSSSRLSSSSRVSCSCCCHGQPCQQPCAAQHASQRAAVVIQGLPCGHEFCSGCIQQWLKEHTSCPVCRWTFPEADTSLINK